MESVVLVILHCVLLVVTLGLGQPASSREIENIQLDEDGERDIVSPDYPDNFDLNLEHLWLVSTNPGRNIHLEFTELFLRENLDFIYVGDGSMIDETAVYLNLTGSDPALTTIVSHNENIWIWFISGGQGDLLANRRFKAEMKETERISLDDDNPAQITSRNYPSDYPNNCHQRWFVSSPSGSRIRIRFFDFALEQEADYVTIGTDWEAVGEDDHVLIRYSGEFLPDDVVTPTGEIWIEMMTDRKKDDDGFRLTLQSTQLEPTLNNYLLGFQTLSLRSPNYPESDYPDDADISWIVTSEPSFKLLIMFEDLDTETGYDILRLGYGTDPDDYSTVLNEFSGKTDGEGAFSISNETWLRFTTDGAVNYGGFSLHMYAVESDADVRRNITFDSEGQANIFSPNFPLDYPIYSNELWTISSPPNHLILLQFKTFLLENVRYDSVTVGTGWHPSDVDSEVIGVYGGTVIPGDIASASPYLWLHFISDQSVCFQGFWIVATAVPIEAQTTVIPTLDMSSSPSKATGTPLQESTASERQTPSLYTQQTAEPTLIPTTDPTITLSRKPTRLPTTERAEGTISPSGDPTAIPSTEQTLILSEDPSATRSLAPSQSSDGIMMSSATGLTLTSTSSWSIEPGLPGSNASQTDLKKIVAPTVIIPVFVLFGLMFLVVLWRVRRSRKSPPLVGDSGKDVDEDAYNNHINPAYEYQIIDHIKQGSTHHSSSHGRDSIQKPLPLPPTDIAACDDDHRYSTYIDTMSRKMKTDIPMCAGDENDGDSGCDESGIGSEELHRYPHQGSNIGVGLEEYADIEYYGSSDYAVKSVDGQSDNEVYQEIPYERELQEKRSPTDSGADKMKICEISSELLKVACRDDHSRARSNSDAMIASSLIDNDLYVPVEQSNAENHAHIHDEKDIDVVIADGQYKVRNGERTAEILTNNSDAAVDEPQESLYDDTAPLDDTFYYIVTRNESDDENINEKIQAKPMQPDNCDPASRFDENNDAVEIHDRTIHHVVGRNEIVDDVDNGGVSNDYVELDPDDRDEAINDTEYQIVDRNESDDENVEEIDKQECDNAEENDAGIIATEMVENELYRPLSIVEDSGNLNEDNQFFQNDTVI